jgi:lysophospholipase L1-like esterase
MKIVCYGDSNTYGFDPRLGTPGRLAKNERWTGILDSEPDIEIANEGMNGRCIPSASYEYRSLRKILECHYDADMLIIMLGSNDLFMTREATAEKISDKMRNVFLNVPELIRWKTSGTMAAGNSRAAASEASESSSSEDSMPASHRRILLICPPAPSDRVLFYEMAGIPMSQSAESAARVMKELPEKLAAVATEFGLEFADATKWNIACMFDGLHFSEEGHRTFAKQLLKVIRGR